MNLKRQELAIQSLGEELANSITHGVGFILSLVGLFTLVYSSLREGSVLCVLSCTIYGISLAILYLMSTLYHSFTDISKKKIFQKLDHMGIYLLIAGTYMPIALIVLKGTLGWTLFILEYVFCSLGMLFKTFFGSRFEVFSILFYLLMGWIAIFAIKPLFLALPFQYFMWIILGGIFYTLGVFFYANDKKKPYFHAIWHLFVLAGSFCHFLVVFSYIIPFS